MLLDDAALAKESADLLAHLIRNECERRHTGIGLREPQHRRAGAVSRRQRSRPRAVLRAAGSREPRRAHRGQRPEGAHVVAHGPHRRRSRQHRRLAARSVRGRDRRRRGVGPRRGRHAQPHRDDGRRVPRSRAIGLQAEGHARVPRGCRRGEPRHVGRRAPRGARARRGDGRLRRDRGGRVPDAEPEGPAPAGDRGREGLVLVPHHRARNAGSRVAAVPYRQRARDRGRDRAPARGVPAAHAHPRDVAPVHRGCRLRPRMERRRCSTRSTCTSSARSCRSVWRARRTRARTRRSRPRSSTVAPRPTSSPIRSTSRSTSARFPVNVRPTCASSSTRRSAISPATWRSRRSTRTSRPRRPPTRRCGTRWIACRSGWSRDRRSCRSSPSVRPTPGSSAVRVRSPTATACSAGDSRSTTTRRCSTATTSASTPSHSCSRPASGTASRDLLN